MLFNLRGGLSRYENFSGSLLGAGFDPRQLGFPSSLVSQFTTLQFPRFNLATYSELRCGHTSPVVHAAPTGLASRFRIRTRL
jgi:hypothetical protein